MMIWMRFWEISMAAWQEFLFGSPNPENRPAATVISLAAERARRRGDAVRPM
jgi:hypothetical protein